MKSSNAAISQGERKRPYLQRAVKLVQNVIVAPDPGLERLGSAARSLLVVLGATAALYAIQSLWDMPLGAFLLGVTLALQVNLFIRDETRKERLGTAMYALAAALLAIAIAAALGSVKLLDQWMLLPVVFMVFFVQRYGLRAKTVGLMFGWMYLFGAYYRAEISQLGWYGLSFVVAFAVFFLIRFFIWRDDRRKGWRYYFQALFVHVGRLLEDACEGKPGKRRELQVCSIAVEDRLYRFGHVEAVSAVQNLCVESERLASILSELSGPDVACDRVMEVGGQIRRYPFRGLDFSGATPKAWMRMENALTTAAESIPSKALKRRRLETPRMSKGNQSQLTEGRLDHSTRKAIQATLAIGVTLFVSLSISTTHWLWGILAALFVFMGSESSGHVFDKGLQRVSGTFLGVVAGLALARLLAGAPGLEAVVVLAGVFLLVYFHTVNYTLSTFALVVSIGLIYNISNLPHLELMGLRLIETAIGALAGFVSARFVLSTHTHRLVRAGSADLLRVVRHAVADTNDNVSLAVFALDRQRKNLEDQVNPLLNAINFIHRKRVARRSSLFDLTVHFTKRYLNVPKTGSPAAEALCGHINGHLEALLAYFEDGDNSLTATKPPTCTLETPEELALSHLEKSLRDLVDEFRAPRKQ